MGNSHTSKLQGFLEGSLCLMWAPQTNEGHRRIQQGSPVLGLEAKHPLIALQRCFKLSTLPLQVAQVEPALKQIQWSLVPCFRVSSTA